MLEVCTPSLDQVISEFLIVPFFRYPHSLSFEIDMNFKLSYCVGTVAVNLLIVEIFRKHLFYSVLTPYLTLIA